MPELKLVIPKNPKHITLAEAKVGHYLLWDYISKSEGDNVQRKPNIVVKANIRNRCYACQYAWANLSSDRFGGGVCLGCPIIWDGADTSFCVSAGSSYAKWIFARQDDIDQVRALAKKIRDMPWCEDPQPSELINDLEIMKTLTIQIYTEEKAQKWTLNLK